MSKFKHVVLPVAAPWIVEIDGTTHVTSSTVCRLLLEMHSEIAQLTGKAQKAKAKPKKKAKAKAK